MRKLLLCLLCMIPVFLLAQEAVKEMTFSSSILSGARSAKIPLASSATGTASSGSATVSPSTGTAAATTEPNRKRITILRFSDRGTVLSQEMKSKLAEIKSRALYKKTTIFSIECFGEDAEINSSRCAAATEVLRDSVVYYIPIFRSVLTDDPKEKNTIKITER